MRWRPWSEEAFRESAESGRPILLFITVAWSPACAEMARATLGDPLVEALVEREFVPVRVDADLRPDVAERYALDGWPTTVLLTDDGEILQGGTYFDARALAGLLDRTSASYRTERDEIARRAAAARRNRASGPAPGADAGDPDPEAIAAFLLERMDARHGGFAGAPKFLHADAAVFLLRCGVAGAGSAARLMLDAADRALCAPDGAMFRFALGEDWSSPVAEVTAENQAAAIRAFAEGSAALGGRYTGALRRASDFARRTWLLPPGERLQTDSGAALAAACLAAARVLDDAELGRAALALLERVALATYQPGRHVRHFADPAAPVLLADHVATVAALLDAHDATGQVAYSMLAEEIGHLLVGGFFDPARSAFRDRLHGAGDLGRLAEPAYPYRLNALAAQSLGRLATASGDNAAAEIASRVLGRTAAGWRERGLDAASCGIAVLDLIDWRNS